MRPSVHEDLAPNMRSAFVDDENPLLLRKLNKLSWERRAHRPRTTGRKAQPLWVIFTFVQAVVVVDRRSPWLKRDERFVGSAAALTAIEVLWSIRCKSREILDRRQTPNSFLTAIASEIDRSI